MMAWGGDVSHQLHLKEMETEEHILLHATYKCNMISGLLLLMTVQLLQYIIGAFHSIGQLNT